MSLPQNKFHTVTLQAFAVAVWGACLGVFLTALALGANLKATDELTAVAHPSIVKIKIYEEAATVPWQEVFEKRMYLINCLICPILAWLSVTFISRPRGWTCLASFFAFVPTITWAYATLYQGEPEVFAYLSAAFSLAIPWLEWSWFARMTSPLFVWLSQISKIGQSVSNNALATDLKKWQTPDFNGMRWRLGLGFALAILLVFFFFPLKFNQYASYLGGNIHVCTWAVALPALYYLNPELLPGVDFESHYGVGHAYVFSFFLGDSLHATLRNYVFFAFLTLMCFYISAYLILSNMMRSATSGFLATLLVTAVSMEAESYGYPSNWPLRFPFLFLFVGCAAQAEMLRRTWIPVVLSGGLTGLSLFWQTDAGLYFLLAGVGYYGALTLWDWRGWWRLPLFVMMTVAAFGILLAAAFGSRALSPLFISRMFEPLFFYSSGFGFRLMSWQPSWSYLYNIAGPVVSLASLGWALLWFRGKYQSEKIESRYLFLFSAIGLMMLFKWVNRSIDIVWSINAMPIVVVLFWWLRYGALVFGEYLENQAPTDWNWRGLRLRTLTGAAAFLAILTAAVVTSCFHDPNGVASGYSSSPLVRMTKFTRTTPTVVNKLFRIIFRINVPPLDAPVIDPDDVAFLRAHTEATERVALISVQDWLYLADASRPPRFALLPAYFVYSNNLVDKMEVDVRQTNVLFVERNSMSVLREVNPVLYDRVVPIIQGEFVLVSSSNNLDLYQRVANSP